MYKSTNATGGGAFRSDPPAELLDVTEVAALLGGCSTRHVYRLTDADRMPRPVRLGALVRWRRAELLAWIAAGCPSHKQWAEMQDRGR